MAVLSCVAVGTLCSSIRLVPCLNLPGAEDQINNGSERVRRSKNPENDLPPFECFLCKELCKIKINPLPPSDATQRCRLETEKFILEDLFSLVLSQFKNLSPLWKPEIS